MEDRDFDANMEALRHEFADKLIERLDHLSADMSAFDAAKTVADRHQCLSNMELTAHQLSGSSALFGFAEIGDAAQALETACRDGMKSPAAAATDNAVRRTWAGLSSAAGKST